MNLKYKILIYQQEKKNNTFKITYINKSARNNFNFRAINALFFKDKITLNKIKFLMLNKPKALKVTIKILGG
jgi:hypothetical protein